MIFALVHVWLRQRRTMGYTTHQSLEAASLCCCNVQEDQLWGYWRVSGSLTNWCRAFKISHSSFVFTSARGWAAYWCRKGFKHKWKTSFYLVRHWLTPRFKKLNKDRFSFLSNLLLFLDVDNWSLCNNFPEYSAEMSRIKGWSSQTRQKKRCEKLSHRLTLFASQAYFVVQHIHLLKV